MAPKGFIKDPSSGEGVHPGLVWPDGQKPKKSAANRADTPEPGGLQLSMPGQVAPLVVPQGQDLQPQFLVLPQAKVAAKAKAQGAGSSGSLGSARNRSWAS
eukprot:TRINITY_DN48040_c0_g1_i1.p1 TRINITY_DN48040_c0_g1~~TRINITY_DN48040_c0_g1_i1.p1  ORF type:complete len:101 (-),score=16.84 TRINITY_DN48040_c0_g1_i1:401-703(-)